MKYQTLEGKEIQTEIKELTAWDQERFLYPYYITLKREGFQGLTT